MLCKAQGWILHHRSSLGETGYCPLSRSVCYTLPEAEAFDMSVRALPSLGFSMTETLTVYHSDSTSLEAPHTYSNMEKTKKNPHKPPKCPETISCTCSHLGLISDALQVSFARKWQEKTITHSGWKLPCITR